MQLVIFTGHYPYGSGEEFLEGEMRIAEEHFEQTTIVSAEKNPSNKTRYVPHNAKVVPIREHIGAFRRLLYAIPCLFRRRVWKEFFFALRSTAYSPLTIFSQLLVQENLMAFLNHQRHRWIGAGTDTVYDTYWLGAEFAFENAGLKGLRISRAHGGDCFFDRGYHPYRKEALRNLDFIFPVSEAGRRDILEHYEKEVPGLKQKILTAHLGIRIPDGRNPMPDGRTRTIVTCSNIIPLKRLDLMIDALCEIPDAQIQWIHFGEGSLKERILQYAEEKLSSRKNIRYSFRGYTPNYEIMGFYQSTPVDLFVNCSDVEGIPVSVMEAMAYGIPAIGRDVGGMGELIDSTCGILLPAQTTPQDFASAIQRILDLTPEAYMVIRGNAHSRIAERFNAERNYRELFEFIKGCFHADS